MCAIPKIAVILSVAIPFVKRTKLRSRRTPATLTPSAPSQGILSMTQAVRRPIRHDKQRSRILGTTHIASRVLRDRRTLRFANQPAGLSMTDLLMNKSVSGNYRCNLHPSANSYGRFDGNVYKREISAAHFLAVDGYSALF